MRDRERRDLTSVLMQRREKHRRSSKKIKFQNEHKSLKGPEGSAHGSCSVVRNIVCLLRRDSNTRNSAGEKKTKKKKEGKRKKKARLLRLHNKTSCPV